MVTQIERGQKLYIADQPDSVFEGSLLDVDVAQRQVRLDPVARLTFDGQTKTWGRSALPKGRARVAALAVVHDEENEARHYAIHHYPSPLARAGAWDHPSKRLWTLTIGEPSSTPTPSKSTPATPQVPVQSA